MTKMNQDVKKLWVDALRSGEYKQTDGCLKDSIGYCCLGVLCELHNKVTGDGQWNYDNAYGDDLNKRDDVPPDCVISWAGLPRENPLVEYEYETYSTQEVRKARIAELNDSGMTFADIADIIEEQL